MSKTAIPHHTADTHWPKETDTLTAHQEKASYCVTRAACLQLSRNPSHHSPHATFSSAGAVPQVAAALCSHLVGIQVSAAGWPAVRPPRAGDGLVHLRGWFLFPLTQKSEIPRLHF